MERHRERKLVLIVDDEVDLTVVLAQQIGRAGFSVAVAADGEAGMEKSRFLHPDAVILDIAMPKLDGWNFCERFRSDPSSKDTPIIILTAWLTDDLKRRANAAGASDVMLKPYDEKQLIGLLHSLCETRAVSAARGKR